MGLSFPGQWRFGSKPPLLHYTEEKPSVEFGAGNDARRKSGSTAGCRWIQEWVCVRWNVCSLNERRTFAMVVSGYRGSGTAVFRYHCRWCLDGGGEASNDGSGSEGIIGLESAQSSVYFGLCGWNFLVMIWLKWMDGHRGPMRIGIGRMSCYLNPW